MIPASASEVSLLFPITKDKPQALKRKLKNAFDGTTEVVLFLRAF
jgi:hypothetical protein